MILFLAAILPVIVLCYFIYNRDPHKEPKSILAKMFGRGLLIFFQVLICEIAVGEIFVKSET
jgi:RsiW-degrading membrane proteinase PrsW (M82 family)